jgi:hypothetical protein
MTKYRGSLAIHVGKSLNVDGERGSNRLAGAVCGGPRADELAFGAIIAVAELVDCVRVEDLPAELRGHAFAARPWCWVLVDVRRVEPIACKGAQAVWTTCLV